MNGGPEEGKRVVPGGVSSENDAKEIQGILESAAPEIIRKIPRKQREELARILSLRQTTVHYSHSGPLPNPDDLKRYNSVLPGAAERILKMAETQQSHRLGLEDRAIAEQLRQAGRGQHYGLLIACLMTVASTVMVMSGHDTAGGLLGGTTLISLVTVFITGKTLQASDLNAKREKKTLK